MTTPKHPHPGKPPKAPEKLVVVNGKRKGKVKTHIRRLPGPGPGPKPRYQPPVVASDDAAGAWPVEW